MHFSCPKGAPTPLLVHSRTLAVSEVQTLESGQQQAVAMHGAFPRDHLPQPRSDRNWLKGRARAKGTFYTWKELTAAILLTQRGRGMVCNNLNGAGQCEACREIMPGFQ